MSEQHADYLSNRDVTAAIEALTWKPDYTGIARACTATVELTEQQAAAVLHAYDRGLSKLDDRERQALDGLIAQLKDTIWP